MWLAILCAAVFSIAHNWRNAGPVLIVFTIFPAAAVVGFGSMSNFYGISPFYVISALVWCILFFKKLLNRLPSSILILSLFVLWSIISAFTLPQLFANIGVFSSRFGIDAQVNNLTPLTFSPSQIGQAAYIFLNLGVVIFLYRSYFDLNKILKTVFIIAALLSFWQFISNVSGLIFPRFLIANNLAYAYADNQVIRGFKRVNGSFLEPSTASAFYALCLIYFTVSYSVLKNSILYIISSAILLLMTTATTGIVAASITFGIYYLIQSISSVIYGKTGIRKFLPLLLTLVMIPIAVTFIPQLAIILNDILFQKSSSISFNNRTSSDLYSLTLLSDTYGLGVGLGSNRPSSFLTYMLSNVGIFGSLLFAISLSLALYGAKRSIFVWPFICYLVAKIISLPDVNDPLLWVFMGVLLNPIFKNTYIKSVLSRKAENHRLIYNNV